MFKFLIKLDLCSVDPKKLVTNHMAISERETGKKKKLVSFRVLFFTILI